MEKEQLRQLQLCELDILTKCSEICEKYGLKYFLMFGTLIGAVRHKGFIPWDDDIDIAMPRMDYEKFVKIADRELPHNYKVLHFSKRWDVPNKILRVENTNTTMIPFDKNGNLVEKLKHGIQIDIFPIDGFPSEEKKQKKLFFQVRLYMKIDTYFRQTCSKSYSMPHNIIILLCKLISIFMGRCFWIKKYNSVLKSFSLNESSCVSNAGWGFDPYRIYDANFFNDSVELEFEGRNFKCPKNWEKILKIEYGDFMVLPPKEKRTPLHSNYLYDFKIGYNEWSKK